MKEHLQTICRVLPKKNKQVAIIYTLIAVTVFILSVSLYLSHRQAQSGLQSVTPAEQSQYAASLAENLSRLNSMTASVGVTSTGPNKADQLKLKERLIRQHAPTAIYARESIDDNGGDYNQASNVRSSATSKLSSPWFDKNASARFLNQQSSLPVANATKMKHPSKTIAQGELIHAVLETAINSNLPGMLRAVVSRPVYSLVGDTLLVPKGSRLVGQYSSATADGISRLLIIWTRVILPNGVSISLDSSNTDNLGRSGLAADHIDHHFLARFGQSSLLSMISASVSNLNADTANRATPQVAYQLGMARAFQKAAGQVLGKQADIKPTLSIEQGAKINVFVAKDLDFSVTSSDDDHGL